MFTEAEIQCMTTEYEVLKENSSYINDYVFLYLCGPSGSGKTYLANKLVELWPDEFYKPVQCTSRARRCGEKQDIDYHFHDKERMIWLNDNNYLFCQTRIGNDIYGTPKNGYYRNIMNGVESLKQNKTNIIVVNYQGYTNRLYNIRGVLIGLDYEFDNNNTIDLKRVEGRENRDQREDFNNFLKKDLLDEKLINNSKKYVTPEELRRCYYTICFKKGYYDILFNALTGQNNEQQEKNKSEKSED